MDQYYPIQFAQMKLKRMVKRFIMILNLSACKLDNWIILKSYVKVKASLLKNAFHYSNDVYFCIQIQGFSGVGK